VKSRRRQRAGFTPCSTGTDFLHGRDGPLGGVAGSFWPSSAGRPSRGGVLRRGLGACAARSLVTHLGEPRGGGEAIESDVGAGSADEAAGRDSGFGLILSHTVQSEIGEIGRFRSHRRWRHTRAWRRGGRDGEADRRGRRSAGTSETREPDVEVGVIEAAHGRSVMGPVAGDVRPGDRGGTKNRGAGTSR